MQTCLKNKEKARCCKNMVLKFAFVCVSFDAQRKRGKIV